MSSYVSRRRSGFTLIEVLLVLFILMLLGSMALLGVQNIRAKAMRNAAKAQIGMFKTPLETYSIDMGSYPTTEEGLQALFMAPAGALYDTWGGPYLQGNSMPVDPWKRQFMYMFPGRRNPSGYDIWSVGPDGMDGSDDDIGNWDQ